MSSQMISNDESAPPAAGLSAGAVLAQNPTLVVNEALQRSIIAALVNGVARDLAYPVNETDTVEPIHTDSPQGRDIVRHSAAHVLAQAVQQINPDAKLGIGPPVTDGFYYDFDVQHPFTPEDLKELDKRMAAICKAKQRFVRREVSEDQARTQMEFQPYKLELIGLKGSGASEQANSENVEVGEGALSMYDNVTKDGQVVWSDLCRGPHVPTTGHIPAFALMRTAAAYWRGSEKNPQLQRIYGTAWESKEAQAAYLHLLEEAAKRDHRKLGVELDLFSFPEEIGSGLAVFHPKGGVIRRVMEDYSRRRHEQAGYSFVNTPHVTKGSLFEISGHLQWYAEGMYPPMLLAEKQREKNPEDFAVAASDGDAADRYYLKPMNCPMHNLIYRGRARSYRELPLRLFEFGTVYRYEKSGVVHGLTRARGFTQDDAHIYCTKEQMVDELSSLLDFVLGLLRDYGLDDFYLELSTRGESEKFIGAPQEWEQATQALRTAALSSGLELVPDPGGAAFYGPKISVQAKDSLGRTWQLSTIQVDFQMPQRFELVYQAADGTRQRPVMIHRALFGSIERFFAILLEHYAGAFPAWLAPVQVVGIPIADEHVPYLQQFVEQLRQRGIRAEVDASDDRMQKKIRTAQKHKVPFMVLAGEQDVTNGAVSFRYRNGEQRNGVPLAQAIDDVVAAVQESRA